MASTNTIERRITATSRRAGLGYTQLFAIEVDVIFERRPA
jgi:hypothetical protein